MIKTALLALCCATPLSADQIQLELDSLHGVRGWFALEMRQLSAAFPDATFMEIATQDRMGRATQGIAWVENEEQVLIFEGDPQGDDLFSIRTDHPSVVGPFGLQVGQATLSDAIAVSESCGRGRTILSHIVVCQIGEVPETVGSLIFSDLPGGAKLAEAGEIASEWLSAPLTRIVRFRGNAKCDKCVP